MLAKSSSRNLELTPVLAMAVLLPLVSSVASYYAAHDLMLITIFMLGASAFVVLLRFDTVRRDRFFLVLTYAISLCLILSMALTSDNLAGYDIHGEYNVFLQVSTSGYWHPNATTLYYSVLSVTILPSMIGAVSNLDGVYVFKFVFPIIYSLVPIILYIGCRKFLSAEGAFLSAFLFMSYPTFYVEMLALARQEIGELLIMLILWVLMSQSLAPKRAGTIVMMLLTVGATAAHYSLAYIYIFIMAFVFVVSRLSRRIASPITTGMLLTSALIAVGWYLFAAGGIAFTQLTQFVSFVVESVTRDFLNPSSRPLAVLQAVGAASGLPGLLHDTNRVTQYVVQFCLVWGFVMFARKKGKDYAERNVLPLMAAAFCLLAYTVFVPFFAYSLNLSRLYHIALLFVSPCLVYGAGWLESSFRNVSYLLRRKTAQTRVPFRDRRALAAAILFSYFLFMSGLVWSVSLDRPTSFILDRQRMMTYPDSSVLVAYYNEYSLPQDIAAARWLGDSIADGRMVCADRTSRNHVLVSYGGLSPSNQTLPWTCDPSDSYVYLSVVNRVHDVGTYQTYDEYLTWSPSSIAKKLVVKNMIYSNGGAAIYG